MAEFEVNLDLNGRDEAASHYVALLERQVLGLTLVNLRQKASIEANGTEIEVDYEDLVNQAVEKLASIQSQSKRPFRRNQV